MNDFSAFYAPTLAFLNLQLFNSWQFFETFQFLLVSGLFILALYPLIQIVSHYIYCNTKIEFTIPSCVDSDHIRFPISEHKNRTSNLAWRCRNRIVSNLVLWDSQGSLHPKHNLISIILLANFLSVAIQVTFLFVFFWVKIKPKCTIFLPEVFA